MGEYIESRALVVETVAHKIDIAERLTAAGLDAHVSVDPTQIGHHIDPGLVRGECRDHRRGHRPCAGGEGRVICLMLDVVRGP